MSLRSKKIFVADVGNKKMFTRGKKESGSSEVDRLSDLPNDILKHILCFLDTSNAVQTSVLSIKWRNLWTVVPALNLNSDYFHRLAAFKNFVRNVLSKRDHDSPVGTCCFFTRGYDEKLLKRVINYVKSHGVNHFNINICAYSYDRSCKPFPSRLLECQNLETLGLERFEFTEPFKYTKLASLCLDNCNFFGNSCSFDVLSCCPSLKNLCLSNCRCGSELKVLKISGPHLLSVTIDNLDDVIGISTTCQCEVEISASEVTFFRCTGSYRVDFSVINLPSLKHADLDLCLFWSNPIHDQDVQSYYDNLVKLFEGISNVQSLVLSSSTIKALAKVPGLEHLPTPFSRLKWWKLKQDGRKNVSFQVLAKVSTYLGCEVSYSWDV